jgi:hypothetical protein
MYRRFESFQAHHRKYLQNAAFFVFVPALPGRSCHTFHYQDPPRPAPKRPSPPSSPGRRGGRSAPSWCDPRVAEAALQGRCVLAGLHPEGGEGVPQVVDPRRGRQAGPLEYRLHVPAGEVLATHESGGHVAGSGLRGKGPRGVCDRGAISGSARRSSGSPTRCFRRPWPSRRGGRARISGRRRRRPATAYTPIIHLRAYLPGVTRCCDDPLESIGRGKTRGPSGLASGLRRTPLPETVWKVLAEGTLRSARGRARHGAEPGLGPRRRWMGDRRFSQHARGAAAAIAYRASPSPSSRGYIWGELFRTPSGQSSEDCPSTHSGE